MKRLKMFMYAGALGCALAAGGAQAQGTGTATYESTGAWTGEQLGELCSAKPDNAQGIAMLNLCHGYARGSVAAYQQLQAGSRRPLTLFCLPAAGTTSANAVLGEFATWVKTTPAVGKERAVDALFAFLAAKFPCGK